MRSLLLPLLMLLQLLLVVTEIECAFGLSSDDVMLRTEMSHQRKKVKVGFSLTCFALRQFNDSSIYSCLLIVLLRLLACLFAFVANISFLSILLFIFVLILFS